MAKQEDDKSKKQKATMAELGEKTAGVASSVLLAKIISTFIAAVASIVVLRLLGQSTYGIYILAYSVAALLASVGGIGVATSFSKFIAEYKAMNKPDKIAKIISSGYSLTILVGMALTIITILLSGFVSSIVFGSTAKAELISAVSILIISTMLFSVSYYAMVGFGRKKAIIFVVMVQILTQAIISVALAFEHFGAYAPIIGLTSGLLAGTVATLLSIGFNEKIPLAMPDKESMKELLVFSAPLGVSNAATGVVSNLSNLILGAFSTSSVVGNVAAAQKAGTAVTLATDSVGYSLLPLFASAQHVGLDKENISKIYDYVIFVMFVLFAPAVLYLAMFSGPISYIAFGAGYPLAHYFLVIVSLGLLMTMVSDYTLSLLISRNKVNEVMKFGTAAAIAELVLLIALIPYLKGVGMILAVSILTPAITFILYYRTASRELNAKIHFGRLVRVLIAALICIAAALPILLFMRSGTLSADLLMAAAAAVEQIIIYPAVIAITKSISKKDLEAIKRVSGAIPVAGVVLALLSDYSEKVLQFVHG